MPYFGFTPNCPRCGKKVYHAEQIIAVEKHWHHTCFKCAQCNKALDSRNVSEHNGDIYCKQCHSRQFGTKGYGYGIGAGILNMDGDPEAKASDFVKRSPPVTRRSFDMSLASCANSVRGSKWKNSTFINACGRCGKQTYAAERILAAGSAWHRITCFKCCSCDKNLASTTLAEHQNNIYCKTCYGRKFSIKGYGYGVGAGCLSLDKDSDHINDVSSQVAPKHFLASRRHIFRSQDDLSEKCYRCAGTVYAAERVMAASHVWHKRCFTCLTCSRNLETTILAERNGDIYCRTCYGKQFGPKGFRNGINQMTPR